MPPISDAKLIGSTRDNGFVDNEIYVKPGTAVADKVEIVMFLWILHHLVCRMQIDVCQSECVHSR